MRVFRWLVTATVALIVLGFTLSNLESTSVQLTPFHAPFTLPLYFVILGSLSVGFIWGGLLVWINGAHTRKDLRQAKKQIKALETEIEDEKALNEKAVQDNNQGVSRVIS